MKKDKAEKGLKEKQSRGFFNVTDFDDLVFENRNRDYGAYQLRKRYFRALFAGLIVAVSIALISVIVPFISKPDDEYVVSGGFGYSVSVQMENLEPPEQIYIPPAPAPPAASRPTESVEYVPPVVVDSIIPIESSPVATDIALASSGDDLTEGSGSGFGEDLIPGGSGDGFDEPLFLVEVMPTFRGGDLTKFREWVGKRTNYPEEAINAKLKGTVFLTFIVEKDGSVSNVTVIKGVHPLLDQEAIKAIAESPKWSPGLQRGQPVRVRFQIPLTFRY
ncbi:MAG: energy transducer TonB [Bacteroidales bacterium]|nr:energy transducer TonB [Bacteroidales bacterium]